MPHYTFSLTTLISERFAETRRFYIEALGQTPTVDSGTHVMFESGISIWESAFAQRLVFGDEKRDTQPHFSHELCFDCTELDDAYAALSAFGADFIHPIVEQPWAQRVMRVIDPDGRVLEIGEPLAMTIRRVYRETGSREETSKRTFVPPEALDPFLESAE